MLMPWMLCRTGQIFGMTPLPIDINFSSRLKQQPSLRHYQPMAQLKIKADRSPYSEKSNVLPKYLADSLWPAPTISKG